MKFGFAVDSFIYDADNDVVFSLPVTDNSTLCIWMYPDHVGFGGSGAWNAYDYRTIYITIRYIKTTD